MPPAPNSRDKSSGVLDPDSEYLLQMPINRRLLSLTMQGTATPEDHYWSHLEFTQQSQYPKFVAFLSEQEITEQEEGRVAVISFKDGFKPSVNRLFTLDHLRQSLDNASEPNTVVRRLFILEGLPKKFILLLGSRLRVPPSFFSAHWIDPGSFVGNLVNRSPRHHNNPYQFQLSFTKLHRARIKADPDDGSRPPYWINSSVPRRLSCQTIFGESDGPLVSLEQVSFWATPPLANCDKQPWDAIILVDPPLGEFAKCESSLRPVDRNPSIDLYDSKGINQKGSWYPLFQSQTVLSPNPAEWHESEKSPKMASLFDDMLMLYPLTIRTSTSDLNSCTDICRRLVLSEWTALMRIIEAQVVRDRVEMSMSDFPTTENRRESPILPWARPWHPKDFSRLVRAIAVLKSIDSGLKSNLDALRVDKSELLIMSQWEGDAWKSLREAINLQIAIVEGTLQTYMQAISVRQSLNAGYLTSMATIFIPISLIAGVFSMGGEFAAGESLFWVFWVLAIPVTILGCFLLFTKSGMRVVGRISAERSLV